MAVLRTLVAELPARIGQQVVVQRWVHRRRRLGGMSFLLVRDRSGVVQVVLAGADVGTVVETLPEQTEIAVKGVVTGARKRLVVWR